MEAFLAVVFGFKSVDRQKCSNTVHEFLEGVLFELIDSFGFVKMIVVGLGP